MADIISISDTPRLRAARTPQTRPPQEERVPMDIPASVAVHIQHGGVKLRVPLQPRQWVYDSGQQVAPPEEWPPQKKPDNLWGRYYLLYVISVLSFLAFSATALWLRFVSS